MQNASVYDFCIIGSGKLGLSLAEYIVGTGTRLSLIARSDISFKTAAKIVNPDYVFRTLDKVFYLPKNFIIATRDSEIADTAELLADTVGDKLRGRNVLHCSGGLTDEILKSCKICGANTFAAHPFQTFAMPDARLFKDIYWGIEKNNIPAEEFVLFMKGKSFYVRNEDKVKYHLAAVLMSNYVNATISLGKILVDSFGLDLTEPAKKLIMQTAYNALADKKLSITGPIARGDLQTIEKHLASIADMPEIIVPYCYFGLATLDMVKNHSDNPSSFIANARIMLLDAIAKAKNK